MATTGYALKNSGGDLDNVVNLLSTTSNVDLKVATQTTLYTVPAGKTCVVTACYLRVVAVTALNTAPTLRVGKSAAYTEYHSAFAMTGLDAVGKYADTGQLAGSSIHSVFVAGDVIAVDITVGADATTMTGTFYLMGYLV